MDTPESARPSPSTLTVVIPAHDEEDSLEPTVVELHQALVDEGIPHEIVIVDDCSTDGTPALADHLAEKLDEVRVVHRKAPAGFGRAVRAGVERSRGDVICIYMADRSDHPRDAILYYRKIEEGYDAVFGSRFIDGADCRDYPRGKLVANRLVNRAIQVMFRSQFNDLTNAFKAYRAEVVRASGPYRSSHFNITIEMSLSALIRDYRIAQVPISWSGRSSGVSKLRIREMGRRYLSTLLSLYFQRILVNDDVIAEKELSATEETMR